MTIKKFTSKVNYANKNNSLRVIIPQDVIKALDINASDTLKWIIKEDDDNITVTIEKLIL